MVAEVKPDKFAGALGAHENGMVDWWRSLSTRDDGPELWARNRWLAGRSPEDLKWYVPIVCIDDAGPVSNVSSSYARCSYSVTGRGNDKETRIVIGTGIKDGNLEDKSWQPIIESFDTLAGPVGENEWGASLILPDLDYASGELGMRSYGHANICSECGTSGSDVPHDDYSRRAAWRTTIYDNAGHIACFRQPLHPLLNCGLWNVFTYLYDILHNFDHHGITSTAVGCIFYARVHEREGLSPGRSQEERLAFLNNDIQAFYKHTNNGAPRLPQLKLSNLENNGFPE